MLWNALHPAPPPVKKVTAINDPQTLATLKDKGASLNEADLKALNKDTVFFTMFKNQNMQPVIKDTIYTTDDERPTFLTVVREVAFDYRTKKIALYSISEGIHETQLLGGRCFNGVEYFDYVEGKAPPGDPKNSGLKFNGWSPDPRSTQPCGDSTGTLMTPEALQHAGADVGDLIAAGGLTAQQADTFNQKLQSYGTIRVNDLSLISRKGKQYIRLDMNVVPTLQQDKKYWGMQTFTWSFEATGLDPSTFPYQAGGTPASGQHTIYYVDPATMLPVYSRKDQTPTVDDSGKPKKPATYHQQVMYEYPTTVTQRPLEDQAVLVFSWMNQESGKE